MEPAGAPPTADSSEAVMKKEEGVEPGKDAVVGRLREILQTADLHVVTEKMLRKQLEGEFKTDLTEFKAAIREEINAYLEAQAPAEEEEEEEEEEEQQEQPAKKRKGGAGGFGSKMLKLSPPLAAFLGVDEMPRTQVVKQICAYVKEHELQDPKDKRQIKCDEKMRTFLPAKVTFFSMNKFLSKHVFSDGEQASKRKRDSSDDDDDDDDDDEDGGSRRAKKAPAKRAASKKASGGGGGGGGFTKPYTLSEQLAALVCRPQMSRPELTKFFNEYFKQQNLLDPSNKQIVLCNGPLRELFQVDSFRAFGQLQKLLTPHLLS